MAVPRKSILPVGGRTVAPGGSTYGKTGSGGAIGRAPAPTKQIIGKASAMGGGGARVTANVTGAKTGRVPSPGGTISRPKTGHGTSGPSLPVTRKTNMPELPRTPKAKGRALAVTRGKGKKRGLFGTQPSKKKRRR